MSDNSFEIMSVRNSINDAAWNSTIMQVVMMGLIIASLIFGTKKICDSIDSNTKVLSMLVTEKVNVMLQGVKK